MSFLEGGVVAGRRGAFYLDYSFQLVILGGLGKGIRTSDTAPSNFRSRRFDVEERRLSTSIIILIIIDIDFFLSSLQSVPRH